MIEWLKPDPIARNMDITMPDMYLEKLTDGYCDGAFPTGRE